MEKAKKKILIVDDKPDVLDFLSTLLQDNDFDVVTAMDGEEGFSRAMSEKPDLITLDITMPKESGVRIYRDLVGTAETAAIPVVIVTGISKDFKDFIYGRKKLKPPAGYFEKPIDKTNFVAKIKELTA